MYQDCPVIFDDQPITPLSTIQPTYYRPDFNNSNGHKEIMTKLPTKKMIQDQISKCPRCNNHKLISVGISSHKKCTSCGLEFKDKNSESGMSALGTSNVPSTPQPWYSSLNVPIGKSQVHISPQSPEYNHPQPKKSFQEHMASAGGTVPKAIKQPKIF